MKQLKLKIQEALVIKFTTAFVAFKREELASKTVPMAYVDGSGQSVTAGQVFYTIGSPGTPGYLKIESTNTTTLTGSGNLALTVTSFATALVADGTVSFTILGRAAAVNFDYSSNPVVSNIVLDIPNRAVYKFKTSDFVANISSFDGTATEAVNLQGNLTGYKLNGTALASNTWVTISDIAAEKLTYTPLDQDAAYEIAVDYKARDINNNESTN